MSYRFTLKLCGLLCGECREALAGVEVLLVAPRAGGDTLLRAVAEPKTTFEILATDAARPPVLGRGTADAEGRAVVELSEREYQGGPFEVHLVFRSVPNQKQAGNRGPVHVSLTTVQPHWRQGEKGSSDGWSYCIPAAQWCAIRARFGAWVVCGKVVDEESGVGVAGALVQAFDTDVFQDDSLGSATTDDDGHFRIDYSTEDFERTPFSPGINFELFPGPDLYFRVSHGGGLLKAEDRSVGRSEGRGNSRPCACVTLRVPVKDVVQPPDPNTFPYWTGIGDFNLASDIDAATGRSVGTPPASGGGNHRPNLAFTGNLPLKGIVPWREPGSTTGRLKYRFLVQELVGGAPLVPVTGAMVSGVQVGSRNVGWKAAGDILSVEQAPIYLGAADVDPFVPAPATPGPWGPVPSYTVKVDTDGWIVVSEFAIGGGFGVGGWIMGLATAAIAPASPVADVAAGDPVPPGAGLNGRRFRILFEVARTDGTALPMYGRELARLHVSNHGEVRVLGIAEFGSTGVGCTPLDGTLTVKYTVDHEVLDHWALGVSSAAVFPDPALPGGSTPRGGNGTVVVDISAWPACSYSLSLTTRMALTNGLSDDSGRTGTITFCIDRTM